MILGVQRLGLQTQVDFDDQPGVVVDDPDGAILAEASAIAEPQAKYRDMVSSGMVAPQSPAHLRGSGALGADMRTAGPSFEAPPLNPDAAAAQQSLSASMPSAVPPAPMDVSVPSAAPAPQAPMESPKGLVRSGASASTQTRQVDAGAYGQSLDASAGQANADYDEALKRIGADPAQFGAALTAIRSERAAVEKDLADQQRQKQQLDQQYTQASQVPEDAARLWGQPGFAISAAIGGFFSSLMDLKQARKGQQSLNLGNRFWAQIDRIVDRDVQAQRANKSSQLAMLERQLGSAESAVSALKSQRYGYIAQELAAMQARGQFDAQMREQTEQARSQALERVEGERRQFLVAQAPVVSQQEVFSQPKPAGGANPELLSKWQSLYDNAVKSGRPKEEAAALASAGTGIKLPAPSGESTDERDTRMKLEKDRQQQGEDYGQKHQKARDFRSSVDSVAAAYGVKIDENGKVIGAPKIATSAEAFDPSTDLDELGKRTQAQELATARLKRADVMGMIREPSAKLQDEFAQLGDPPTRPELLKDWLQSYADLARQAEADAEAGFDPEVTEAYRARRSKGTTPGAQPPSTWK